jgi:hypothetical protein
MFRVCPAMTCEASMVTLSDCQETLVRQNLKYFPKIEAGGEGIHPMRH